MCIMHVFLLRFDKKRSETRNVPSIGAGNRLCVVSGASNVPIYFCRRPESGSIPARNEAMARMIKVSIFLC